MTAPDPAGRVPAARTAEEAWQRLRPELAAEAVAALGPAEADAFLTRIDVAVVDVHTPLVALYGERADTEELLARALRTVLAATAERPAELRLLDRRREIDPHWFQRERMQGYVCYVDRFCGTLDQLPGRLDHLTELGTTYLHLMPLLRPREGENDGGYAVADYRQVDPRLGTMTDLEAVAAALRGRDMSLCIDLVLNHTAAEHHWAQAWLAGDHACADFYTAFPDRTLPDAYEATIPEVFPDRAPGSFSWVPEARGGAGGWVWTTFWSYQWDLDYTNPEVTLAMLGEITWLANRGVEVFRMDAIPFMWKRMGTTCQNQPEVHDLVQLLHALTRIAAPAVVFKAEAIVSPEDLVPYLGAHERERPECELAYHNQLMVLLWSSLATEGARLATAALRRMQPVPAGATWVTYVRGHDDIGWAITDPDAVSVGADGAGHRRFLNDFFSGRFPASPARGALFQENRATGDARICGTAASLCGIEDALARGDDAAVEQGIRRLVLLYSVAYAFGGIPLLYMGDELALPNDAGYLADPELAPDNRWMHRPAMDWAAAARRHDPATLEGRVFARLCRLGEVRRSLPALRGGAEPRVLDAGSDRMLVWRRRHPRSGSFVGLANFSPLPEVVDADTVTGFGTYQLVLGSDGPLPVERGGLVVPGLGFARYAEP
ncbi:amylosucrase [Modestobacter sp. DSM 44400]|uniref:alpha-amylase family protein n=1 Tax=Modestobacter sp. DSM 44400 TaxID=1550230 RepID=UPI00089B59D9|nr:alpha-amylase family protein [Modestobacter sp. DSM 44400]SDY86297.1 amylosucrase [Modestobacter sp. DSM 44400]